MRTFKLNEPLVYNYLQSGFYSFICREKSLLNQISDRPGVCLKVFFTPLVGEIEGYFWGHPFLASSNRMLPRFERTRLVDAVIMQNLCAWFDLAPRVYEIVLLRWEGKDYPALVVDDLGFSHDLTSEADRLKVFAKIEELGKEYGFKFVYKDLGQASNIVKGKLVDFQGLELSPEYREMVIKRYRENAQWSENTYQSIPELGIEGYRDNARRLELMGLDKIDFKDKYVIDIGCSGGFYCRYAASRGAKRVMGIDLPEVAEAAFEISNFLGYYNIDFVGTKLEKEKDYDFGFAPNVIFFLSVQRYFGYAPFLKKADTVIYEHNGDEPEEEIIKKFQKDFKNMKDLGITGQDTGSKDNRRTLIFSK
jgi:hypothetical protein